MPAVAVRLPPISEYNYSHSQVLLVVFVGHREDVWVVKNSTIFERFLTTPPFLIKKSILRKAIFF